MRDYPRYMAHKIPNFLLKSIFISYLSKLTLLGSPVSHSMMLRGIMLSLTLFNSKNGRLRVKDEEIQIVLLLLGGVLMICFLLSCRSIKVVKDVQSFLSNFKGVEESGTFFPYQRRAITYNVSGLLIVSLILALTLHFLPQPNA